MPDGRLKSDSGSMLDAGPNLTAEDAKVAVGTANWVLLHSYPDTEDITKDTRRVAALLETVSLAPELEGHRARVYKSGSERILVIEHHH